MNFKTLNVQTKWNTQCDISWLFNCFVIETQVKYIINKNEKKDFHVKV